MTSESPILSLACVFTEVSFGGFCMENDGASVVKRLRLGRLLGGMNPISFVAIFVIRHLRGLVSILAMVIGGYLVWSGFGTGIHTDDLVESLKKIGAGDLLRHYDEAKDANERKSWRIVFGAYEKRYGKGAWVRHFKEQNYGEDIAYRDIAEIAVGISNVEERDEFIAAHAATYEACIQDGKIELALQYGKTLVELRNKGGKSWRLASNNPFALCVYEAVGRNADLWNWYIENAKWCDSFLMTIEPPELQERNSSEGAGLAEAVEAVRDHSLLLKKFAKEIGDLTDDELKEMADGDNLESCKESLFASSLMFVGLYHNVLTPILKASPKISMLEAMAVVANNATAFGLGEEDAIGSPNKCRAAAMEFLRIHDERKALWDFAVSEKGTECITFSEKVGNYGWCEEVIDRFGEVDVVPFLNKYYGDSVELLRVATETLYLYKELGWAVLQEYCDNPQVKRLLLKPRIGARLAPFFLKKGYAGFALLDEDERWIDEVLDSKGNVKRLDVSWYEMLPIGGDVATVVKKWVQKRPVTNGEYFWAAFDIVDTAGMAISFGASKIATTGAKTATKVAVKRVAQRTARGIAKKTARRMAVTLARRTANSQMRTAAKGAAKAGVHKISFLKKVNKWFRKVPGVALRGKDSAIIAKKSTLLTRTWNGIRNLDAKTWKNMYKGCKTLMWCRYVGHTIPDKGPDFVYTVLESSGAFVGKTLNAFVAGAGNGLKAAVRETLGLPDSLCVDRILKWTLGGVMFLFGFFAFVRAGRKRRNEHCAKSH